MIIRQTNWLGQMRIDLPLLRAMESSVAADFDLATGTIFGGRQPLVIKGFSLANITVGSALNQMELVVAGAVLVNFNATESGSMFSVAADATNEVLSSTNSKVVGSFTSSATNFIGLDLIRSADDTTSDTLQFINSSTLVETSRTVPLARTLNFRIVISTADFSSQPNLVPIAKVVADSSNNVSSVEDARNMAFRLADGGDFPNIQGFYSWPGSRWENTSGDIFAGGDKAIGSQKEWQDAVMTRLWELGGGEYWYSATADRNVNMVWTGSTFTNGENFEWDGTNLHWKGLRFIFDDSTGYYNDVANQTSDSAGLTNLTDGQCIYVDLDRSANKTGGSALLAAKATTTTLGPGAIPGARQIIAWRVGSSVYTRGWRYPVGTTFVPATNTSLGVVKLSRASGTPSAPVVLAVEGGDVAAPGGSNTYGAKFTGDGPGAGIKAVGGASGPAVDASDDLISNVADPVGVQDASTRAYTDAMDTGNVLNNGNFDFWQRGATTNNLSGANKGATHAAAAGTYNHQYTADRWYAEITDLDTGASGAILHVERQTTGMSTSTYCARLLYTPIVDQLRGGIVQEIDRSVVAQLVGRKMTLRFKIRTDALAGLGLHVRLTSGTNAGGGVIRRSYSGAVDLISYDGTMSGYNDTTFTTVTMTASAVVPSNCTELGLAIYVDGFGDVDTFFVDIAEVVLVSEVTAATLTSNFVRFNNGNYSTELAACQRYYEKSYQLDSPPGSNDTYGVHVANYPATVAPTTGGALVIGLHPRFTVRKASNPYAVLYQSTVSNTINLWDVSLGATTFEVGTISDFLGGEEASETGFIIVCTDGTPPAAPGTASQPCLVYGHWAVGCDIGDAK